MRSGTPQQSSKAAAPKLHVVQLSLGEQMGEALLARLQHAKPPAGKLSPAKVGAAKPRGSGSKPAMPASPAKLAAAKARGHDEPAQTEPALLEALPFPLPGCAEGTQTDVFASAHTAPPPPLRKAGVDAATSIEPGDLFDFEREVAPVLERLVGGALEAAASEAAAELRLEAVRQRRQQIEEARYRELVEVQRMQGDDRRRREAEQRAREAEEEKARRAAALQAKLGALALAREMVQGALGSVQGRAQQRPSSSASQLSFGRAAEAEVMAYLEAAGTGQLRAMRMSSSSRTGSLASSRGGSRRSTLQSASVSFAAAGGAQGSARNEAAGSAPATAAPPAAAADREMPVVGRASGGGEPPAPVRPLTALAADVAGQALQQAVIEAGAREAAPRPLTALAADVAGRALEQAVTEVGLGEAAMDGPVAQGPASEATAAPEAAGTGAAGCEAEPMETSPPEQLGVSATEGASKLEASAAQQAAAAEPSAMDQTAVESESLPVAGAEMAAPVVQPVAEELPQAALELGEAHAAAEAAAGQDTS